MSTTHILIVDDIAKNIQVAANVLKSEDCKISFAQSGEKALEIMNQENISLVLLDVMMPNMDGFEVCERIREDPKLKNIPVIFLTAKTDTESITHAFQLGGVDYISKPFNNEELLARVRTHLRLHRAQLKIEEQNQELQETNDIKDKLFSIIAHDLRNPFNGLLVLTDILRMKFDKMKSEDILEMIELIYHSSKDGYDLLENLLEWSRAQRNQIEFKPSGVNINQLVQGNIQVAKPMAHTKGIEIQTNIGEVVTAFADPHMLDTIIRNLITNAIKFTDKEGAITVSAKNLAGEIEFSVSDSGIGISPDQVEHFFDNLGQKSTLGTSNEKGTGLGLVLCKEFIDLHNGRIWVESVVDVGSTFKFRIPAVQPQS